MKSSFLVILLGIVSVLVVAGCAYNRPVIRTETHGTNGVVTVSETSARTFALWPATSDLANQKLANGRTQSIGTAGLEQSGGATNVVEALRALDSILGKIRP
jgi:Flp pilus assembly protein TadG